MVSFTISSKQLQCVSLISYNEYYLFDISLNYKLAMLRVGTGWLLPTGRQNAAEKSVVVNVFTVSSFLILSINSSKT